MVSSQAQLADACLSTIEKQMAMTRRMLDELRPYVTDQRIVDYWDRNLRKLDATVSETVAPSLRKSASQTKLLEQIFK